jgi:PAS domain S-box-containing protein
MQHDQLRIEASNQSPGKPVLSSSFPRRLGRRLYASPVAAVSLLATLAILSLILRSGPAFVAYYDISCFVLLLLACVVAIWNAMQSRQAIRLFWSFLAVAFGLWALVPGSWFNGVVLHGRIPEFLFDNPPLFLHIVFMIAAVASRPHLQVPSRRPYRTTLNFLILLFVWVFAYMFFLFPYEYGARGTVLILHFEAVYFGENLLLLAILGRLIFRSQSPWKSIYIHLFGASSLYVIGSMAFNLVWALKDPLGDLGGVNFPVARGLIGMAFTASIFWFLWIGIQGGKLKSKLANAVVLDTTEQRYSSVLALIAVLAIPAVGTWELFRTDEPINIHEARLVLVMVAGILLAVGAFAENYLVNREFTSDVGMAHDRLRLAMESGKSMGWDWDLVNGQNIWFGDLKTTFGISADTYLAGEDEFFERLHPDDRERVSKALTVAMREQTPYRAEYRVVRPDGSMRWLADRGEFLADNGGGATRGLGIAVDVTDRKQAEEARLQKEIELQKTEKLAKVGAWRWNPETDTVTWSEEIYRIAAIDPAQPAPSFKEHPKLYTAESWGRLRSAVEEALRTGTEYKLDLEMIRPDGTTRWVIGRGEAILDAKGRVVQLHGTVQDINERKQAEGALRESEERFRLVSNTAPVMIWMSDTDKLCTYFNKPWLDFTGRPLSAELGNGWADGVHPEDLQRSLETFNQAFDRREPFKMEYRLRASDGEFHWVLDIGVPRFNSDGSFAGYIGSCLDVTEHKLAEDVVRSVSSRLIEAQEEERTRIARELHDDFSQRMALLAVELDAFKHDIPDFNGDALHRLDLLRQQTLEIGSDIQALSHELHSSKLEYLGVVPAMRGFCEEFGEKQKLKIIFQSHSVPGPIAPDVSLCLFRVLQEALHNAAKHSRVSHFDVYLEGIPGEIQLTISDAGVGFDVESANNGRGLGLISMRERVKVVKGTITISSKPMQGTEISVRIPLGAAPQSVESAAWPLQAGLS